MAKKNKSQITAIFGAVIGITASRFIVHNFFGNQKQIEVALDKTSMEINKSLPIQLDSETELFSTLTVNNKLTYNYRLINYLQSEIDINLFEGRIKNSLFNHVCSTPDTKDLLNKDVILKYRYHDQTKVFINEIEINKNKCVNI